ncbi:MAG: hypothetical protein EOM14_00535 [Clostridia bacterium]|nr:hypothetical protein [Clostridia bacterium]
MHKEKGNVAMKKITVLILAVAIAVCMLGGCGGSTETPDASTSPEATTRTVTDMVGRTVEIPTTIEKICPLANTPRMITYLGLADKAVAISGFSYDTVSPVTAYAYASKDYWKDLPMAGTDGGGATDYYPEVIIAADPDIILCSYDKELADEIQTKTGIPVVSVVTGTLFGEDYDEALRLLGDICGASEKAEQIISCIHDCLDDLAARTADIPDEGKPTVMTAAVSFKGTHGIEGVGVNSAIFEAIAANDVTAGTSEKSGGMEIDREQILAWNPQIIFLDTGGLELVKQDYADNPDFYAQLQAFTDGNVYQCPSATAYYSNVEIPLVNCYYDASILYPEQFADVDFEAKANEIFKLFLGVDNYLDILNDAGYGYGKADFGA